MRLSARGRERIRRESRSFTRTWRNLKASSTGWNDYFGGIVALSGDTLVVAAHRESSAARGAGGNQDDDSAEYSGAVYTFH